MLLPGSNGYFENKLADAILYCGCYKDKNDRSVRILVEVY